MNIAWPDLYLSLHDATAAESGPIWSYTHYSLLQLDKYSNDSTCVDNVGSFPLSDLIFHCYIVVDISCPLSLLLSIDCVCLCR